MSGEPTPEEGKYKDIPSILPLAPGGVYAVKWEQREKWAECLRTPDVPYTPPLGAPNPDNPVCFFEIRAGGYYLGRVTFELKADTHPVTSENFLKLCEFKCYAATKFKVFPGNWIRGGDFTDLDEVVYDANDPDFFDFPTLLPDAAPMASRSAPEVKAKGSSTSSSAPRLLRPASSSSTTKPGMPRSTKMRLRSSAWREHISSIAVRRVAVTMASRKRKWHTMFMNPFACVGGGHTPAM